MKKYFLSFQTVFRLNENIKYLEEFLIYYINIGFDHFYLYNNDGSITDFFNESSNKHGDKITNDEPEGDKKMFEKIMKKYGDKITYTKWQPIDNDGNIVYGQDYATMDFIKRYSDQTEWVAIMDLDEFLISENNINILNYFKNLSTNISCVFLGQKKFIHRIKSDRKYITQDFRCGNYIPPGGGGSKNIVRTSDFVDIDIIKNIDISNFELNKILKCKELNDIDSTWHLHVHNIIVKNEKIQPLEKELRFNHYNDKSLENSDNYDDGMKIYNYIFENIDSNNIENFSNPNQNNYNFIFYFIFFIYFIFFTFYLSKKNKKLLNFTTIIFLFVLLISSTYFRPYE